jgi:SPOR domain
MSKRVMCAIAAATACAALLLGGCSRESADWKQASVANTPEAYQLFLQQHPHAAEAPQAQSRLQQLSEQRDWQIASATDTRDGYQQFVTKHPDSKWVQEARIRIENFAQAGVSGGAALAANPAGEPVAGAAAASGASTATHEARAQGAPAPRPSTVETGPAAPAASSATARVAAPGAPPAAAARTSAPTRTVSRSHPSTRSLAARRAHSVLVARAHRTAHSRPPLLQLGAFRSKARAQSEWRELTARFSTLKSLTPHYVVARSRGERVVRLQVRVSSTRVASGLCATLRRHARPCVRVNAA